MSRPKRSSRRNHPLAQRSPVQTVDANAPQLVSNSVCVSLTLANDRTATRQQNDKFYWQISALVFFCTKIADMARKISGHRN